MSSFATVSRVLRPVFLSRSFHSPFALLANSNLASPPPPSSNITPFTYDKQSDVSPEPTHSHYGPRTYVVSQPDPADTYYHVPSGAYPTSLPYVNFTPTEAPESVPMSSSSSTPAHPVLTRAVPQNESGVGESAAVRFAEAPGAMGARGGSYGGAGLVDKEGTKPGVGSLADRNPPPIESEVVEKFSKMGNQEAWKARK